MSDSAQGKGGSPQERGKGVPDRAGEDPIGDGRVHGNGDPIEEKAERTPARSGTVRTDQDPTGAQSLLTGIERDVRQEAHDILDEARKEADRRRALADQQVASIAAEAEKQARNQASAARNRLLSGAAVEARRRKMQAQEKAFQDLMREVRVELAHRIGKPGYRENLVGLIAEAAVGLGVEEAVVNASAQERSAIDAKVLRSAEKKAESVSGLNVHLQLSDEDPLHGQGVVLYSKDDRLAFSNQAETRINRRLSEIRDLAYSRLFST